METLEGLLLKEKFEGSTLFGRAVDIVNAMLSDEDSPLFIKKDSGEYDKKFQNLKTYTSQILNGKRSASKEIALAFEIVIKKRITDIPQEVSTGILNNFRTLIASKSNKIFISADSQWEFDELNEKFKIASKQVTITARPIETFENYKSDIYLQALLENLGLSESNYDQYDDAEKIYHEYFLPDEATAFNFYRAIFAKACLNLKKVAPHKIAKKIEEINRTTLKVFLVERTFCTFRQIVFNHQSLNPAGFIVFTHGDIFSVSKMSASGIQRWREDIYNPCSLNGVLIKFEKFRDRLLAN